MNGRACLLATAFLGCGGVKPGQGTVQPDVISWRGAGHADENDPSCRGETLHHVWTSDPRICVTRVADHLDRPRDLVVASDGQMYVATRAGVSILWDDDHDGRSSPRERALIGARDADNHGIALSPDRAFLYYAGGSTVRRIPFRPAMRGASGTGEVVVRDIPYSSIHPYKSITFDRDGRLYVETGSANNFEAGPGAAILRYTLPAILPAGGLPYESGERFATGLRNASALAWDHSDRLWALSAGVDFLQQPGQIGTYYFDNPGDEVVLLSARPGTFYGYPQCWPFGTNPAASPRTPGMFFADVVRAPDRDDAWCQDPANVRPAAGALPAHSTPLGAVEYRGALFPEAYRGNLFVTLHGSWNRPTAQVGRTIARVVIEGDRVQRYEPFVGERLDDGSLREGQWTFRPVGIAQGADGALYVTSDESGEVIRIGYRRGAVAAR